LYDERYNKKLKAISGETILIDYEYYEMTKQYKWSIKYDRSSNRRQVVVYAKRKGLPNGVPAEYDWNKGITYKKLILGLTGKFTLFKNDNPLDLRKENIMVFDDRSEFVSAIGKIYRKKNPEFNIKISKGSQGKRAFNKKAKFKYVGVRCDDLNIPHPWISIIIHNGKNYYLGSYTKEEYAALAYDKKALEIYGPDATVNFPDLTLEEITEKLEKIKAEDAIIFLDQLSKRHQGKLFNNVEKTSMYVGVCLKNGRGKWRATINFRNKQYALGEYNTEEEAARAYDKKAIEFYGENARLNFPIK
jgi:hypothetical protein